MRGSDPYVGYLEFGSAIPNTSTPQITGTPSSRVPMLVLGNFKEVEDEVEPALRAPPRGLSGRRDRCGRSGLGSCNGQKDFRVRPGAWSPLLVTPRCI